MFNLSIYNVCGKTKGIKLSILPCVIGLHLWNCKIDGGRNEGIYI